MIETIEKVIDGSRYAVTQMTARRALRMKSKLIKVFGSSLFQILMPGEKGEEKTTFGFSKEDGIKALKSLSLELDENTFETLIVKLLETVRKEGVELTKHIIDLEFAGDLGTLYKVVFLVLEVNFGSFLEEMGISMSQEMPE